MRYHLYVFGILSLLFVAQTAMAAGTGLTYHGRILKPDGNALEGSAVQFTLQIRSPGSEACLLYQETQTIDMSGSGGAFALEVGTNPTYRVAAGVDGGYSLSKIFANQGTLTVPSCNFGTTYTPNTADGRVLYISFNDGSGAQNLSAQKINFVPFAIEAMQLNGYTASQFLRTDSGTAPALTAANLTTLADLFNGTLVLNTTGNVTSSGTVSGAEVRSSAIKIYNGSNYVQLSAPTLTGNVNFKLPAADGTSGQVLKTDGAGNLAWVNQSAGGGGTVTSVSVTAPIVKTGTAADPVISISLAGSTQSGYLSSTDWNTFNGKISSSDVTSALVTTALGFTPLNKAGDTMSGDLGTQNISMAGNKYLTLSSNATPGTVAGQMWFDSGAIKYFDGSIVKSLGTGSGNQTSSLTAGHIWVGNASGVAQAFALSGDISAVSNAGSVTVNKTTTAQNNTILALDGSGVGTMKGLALNNTGTVTVSAQTASATYGLTLPAAAPTGTQTLQADGSGNLTWVSTASLTDSFVKGGNTFSANSTIGLNDNFDLGFKTNNTVQMTLTKDGKLGIGTTGPGASLHIQNGRQAIEDNTNTNAASSISFWKNRNYGATQNYDEHGSIQFYGHDGTSTLRSSFILALGEGTPTTGSVPGSLGFYTTTAGNADSTEKLHISADGNIGIGTSVPDRKLTIIGDGTAYGDDVMIEAANSELVGSYPQINLAKSRGTVAARTQALSGDTLGALSFRGYNTTSFGYSANIISKAESDFTTAVSGDLRFQTSNAGTLTDKMTIKASGNVGIGTSTPVVSLDLGSKTDAIRLPAGTTAQQPSSAAAGMIRYNTSNNDVEYYNGTAWTALSSGGGSYSTITGPGAISITAGGTNQNVTLTSSGSGVVTSPSVVTVTNTTASTGYNNGALVVSGGLGVAGAINSNSNITAAGTITSTAASIYKANGDAVLSVQSDNTSTTTARYPRIDLYNFMGSPSTGSGGNPGVNLINYRGTSSTTAAMRVGESLGSVVFGGSYNTSGSYYESASIWAQSTENFSSTAAGTNLQFFVTPNGTKVQKVKMLLDQSGYLGLNTTSPTEPLHIVETDSSLGIRIENQSSTASRTPGLTIKNYSGTFSGGPTVLLESARGSSGSATAIKNSDNLGQILFQGLRNGSSYSTGAMIYSQASEDWAAGTAGTSLIFSSTSSGATTTTERMRIDGATGRIGIGASSPNHTLQVGSNGSSATKQGIYVGTYLSSAGSAQYNGNWASSGYWGIGPATNASDSTILLGNTTDQQGTWNGTQTLNLAVGGKVGVGTISPGAPLDVRGSRSWESSIITQNTANDGYSGLSVYDDTSTIRGLIGYGNSGAGAAPSSLIVSTRDTTTPIVFGINASEVARLSTSGYFGIGTSAPVTSLHIVSNKPAAAVHPDRAGLVLEAEGTSVGGRIAAKVFSDSENPLYVAYRARGTKASPQALLSGDLVTALSPVGYDGSNWQTGAHVRFFTTENWSGSAIGSAITFRTVTNGTTSTLDRMRIDHNGNVGIGTIAPAYLLDVNGTANATNLKAGNGTFASPSIGFANQPGVGIYSDGNLKFSNSGLQMTLSTTSLAFNAGGAGPQIYQTGGDATKPSYAFNVDSDTGMFNPNASGGSNQLAFSTAGTERVRIDAIGRVGIGTTAPEATLNVNNLIQVGMQSGLYSTLGTNSIAFQRTAAAGTYSYIDQAGIGGALTFRTSNAAVQDVNAMTIIANGSVGIGTNAPGYLLDVNGTTANVSGAWVVRSDARLKRDIASLENPLDTVLKLRGVSFHWKNPEMDQKYGIQRGFIAQEMQEVVPEWVHEGNDGYKRIEKIGIEAYFVEAIKELYSKWFTDHTRIAELEKQNRELKEALCEMNPNSKICTK